MYDINWKAKALRQLEKIQDRKLRGNIFDKVDELRDFPNCSNVKVLKGHKFKFRLRVGRYRVLFDAEDLIKVISIEEVKKRDERTY